MFSSSPETKLKCQLSKKQPGFLVIYSVEPFPIRSARITFVSDRRRIEVKVTLPVYVTETEWGVAGTFFAQ